MLPPKASRGISAGNLSLFAVSLLNCSRQCRCQGGWSSPPQQNSTWLTIGGAFAGIGIGIVMLICFLMVCFDRRRHRQANMRAIRVSRTIHSLGTAHNSQETSEVTIPVVVISPTGHVELAKAVESGRKPETLEPTDLGKVMTKGSSVVIITHGEPAFAQADIASIDMDNHLPGSICHGTAGVTLSRQASDVAQTLHACDDKGAEDDEHQRCYEGDAAREESHKPAEARIIITEVEDPQDQDLSSLPGHDHLESRRWSGADCNV